MAVSIFNANKALAKVTIIPFVKTEVDLGGTVKSILVPTGVPFVAMYNPTSFTKTNNLKFSEKQTSDGTPGKLEYKYQDNDTLNIKILLDATGASPGSGVVGSALTKTAKNLGGVDVMVAAFFAITKFPNPISHTPNFLKILWGAGLYFEGKLSGATVSYTLFDRNGRPLRATIDATFTQDATDSFLANIKNFFSSPDVTKTYTVKAGDTIYNLAQKEYNDDSYYLQIAEANDLKNYRKLVPGQVLIFPPIKKDEE
ncbi:MAG: LysM peptidoglycan-binding domain-containing protein [Bacteroidota bacterium]|nr:LysM peptidoglycan-binding domain-containing protein [Bacteroidota bacterium]